MKAVRTIVLDAEPATPESFAPFGVLPGDEGAPPTADLEFQWNDGWVNYIGHDLSEIQVVDGRYRCELLNRHDTHTQTLMPVSDDAMVVVAPAAVDFSLPSHFETVRAFFVPRFTCVHLARGTWHWGPYPCSMPSVRIFNIQGRGYVRDNGIAWLARDHGVAYDICH